MTMQHFLNKVLKCESTLAKCAFPNITTSSSFWFHEFHCMLSKWAAVTLHILVLMERSNLLLCLTASYMGHVTPTSQVDLQSERKRWWWEVSEWEEMLLLSSCESIFLRSPQVDFHSIPRGVLVSFCTPEWCNRPTGFIFHLSFREGGTGGDFTCSFQ